MLPVWLLIFRIILEHCSLCDFYVRVLKGQNIKIGESLKLGESFKLAPNIEEGLKLSPKAGESFMGEFISNKELCHLFTYVGISTLK